MINNISNYSVNGSQYTFEFDLSKTNGSNLSSISNETFNFSDQRSMYKIVTFIKKILGIISELTINNKTLYVSTKEIKKLNGFLSINRHDQGNSADFPFSLKITSNSYRKYAFQIEPSLPKRSNELRNSETWKMIESLQPPTKLPPKISSCNII